ncbi:MAG: DDE-type integrase/transposase/recombinase [Thermoanaerobaculales bacterium]
MEEERFRDVGLFRYSLIRPMLDPACSPVQRGAMVRAVAESEHVGPGGERVTVSRSTVDRWIRNYRAGGFAALVPCPRAVPPATPAEVLALAVTLKRELPARTAAQVRAVMLAAAEGDGGDVCSERTIQRHFSRLGLKVSRGRGPVKVYGRFEACERNELWTGDGLHGPQVGGRKAILLAFIDDFSRSLVGYRWGTAEDVTRLEAALRAGLSARGVPRAILVDRGSAFVSRQLERACAVLGIRLIHASPRAATTKGKIERFFRTVRDQFLVELGAREVADLTELNRLFSAWVEVVYHRRVHTETKITPLERFQGVGPPQLPSPELLREAFLWSEARGVSKRTATVSLHGNEYEVDAALLGRRCELIFDPFDLERIEVRYGGRAMGAAVPVRITRNVHPKVKAEPAPPPASSGIDYLGLIAERRAAELAGKPIDYAALAERERIERDRERTDIDTDEQGSRP